MIRERSDTNKQLLIRAGSWEQDAEATVAESFRHRRYWSTHLRPRIYVESSKGVHQHPTQRDRASLCMLYPKKG